MRLKSNPNDLYTWEKIEKREDFFSRYISDLSIIQLRELSKSVDKLFRAVRRASLHNKSSTENGEEMVGAVYPEQLIVFYKVLGFFTLEVSLLPN